MFHYVNAITNTKGDALIGYFVKVVNPSTDEVMSMFADENSTPISSVSGVENACEVNADGNASFYVADGEYHIDIYATDGATFVRRIEDVPMAKTGLLQADTKADVSNADTGYPVVLKLSGSQGFFIFDSSDLSVEVAADPEQNNFIAPSSDQTGASGAWVRVRDETAMTDSVETRIVSGLGIVYTGNLDFTMGAGSYYLDGIFHNAAEQSLSLDAAHATLDRIDVLYVDSDGLFRKITGTAAASPSKPTVDPTTQLELTFVYVPAAATSLAGVTTENIYLENTEWTTSQVGSALTFDSTNNPYAGTKCIEMTGSVAALCYAKFTRSSSEAFGGDGNLVLRIRAKQNWGVSRRLLVGMASGGSVIGTMATIRNGTYGFDSSTNTTSYQTVIIAKSEFSVAAGTSIDGLIIFIQGSTNNTRGFYLDNIQLQTNGSAIGNSDLTQSIADARYVNVTGDTMTGDLVVPDEAYDAAAWNGSNEVPTKNAIRDKIESIAPGGVVTGALLIANNLSDLNNASTARTNMGLGSIATQAASSVAITGGSVTGITDLAVADGGTGASTASAARTNLGVVIGTDVKAQAPSIQSVVSSATVTPTFSDDLVKITAQAAALNLANWSGTAVPGWGMGIRIKDNGTARAITYGTNYRAIGVTLPTTTVISKTLYLGCIWNSDDSKIDVVSVAQEA